MRVASFVWQGTPLVKCCIDLPADGLGYSVRFFGLEGEDRLADFLDTRYGGRQLLLNQDIYAKAEERIRSGNCPGEFTHKGWALFSSHPGDCAGHLDYMRALRRRVEDRLRKDNSHLIEIALTLGVKM